MLTSKNFSDIVAFTRASAAWRYSSGGILVQESANVPRLDYDPATLAARGLLVEEQRTNLVLQSENFSNSYWIKTAIAVATSAQLAPDGALSAFDITENNGAAGSKELAGSAIAYTAGQTYTCSIFFRAKTVGAARRLRLALSSASVIAGSLAVTFDPSGGGSVSQVVNAANARIEALPNGLFRGQFSFTATNSASANTYITLADTNNLTTYTGDGVSGLTVYGAMIEASGAFGSSYIKTTGSQVTRSPDNAIITDLSKIGFNPSEGTIFVDAECYNANSVQNGGNSPRLLVLYSSANGSENIAMYRSSAANLGSAQISTGGQGFPVNGPTIANGAKFKMAFAYKASDNALCLNGAAVNTLAQATLPSGLDRLVIGSTGSAGYWGGWIRQARYFPRRLTNAELQALTA
ncbi:hypothetical protein KB879_06300 [Cupriavidus sp. KK10]|jgi:hypothetical protein|uniref:phage head spike fiber domain-containing protein n=1 Tax=Cupriavidus sp. KK10 TaxID=1478019 RepID=UPI001BA816AE|nr:hypothetical protein [Cupriavidus sp. KK10]QUN29556.1 hypothetical protein KB879_06300 [Cupriavidus sp. KK10]